MFKKKINLDQGRLTMNADGAGPVSLVNLGGSLCPAVDLKIHNR